jgi:hypothetical protein
MQREPDSSIYRITANAIDSYMLQAVLSTIFCCAPFGIVAMVYAAKVNTLKEEDDIEGALRASQKARKWCKVSLITQLSIVAVYLLFALVVSLFAIFSKPPS